MVSSIKCPNCKTVIPLYYSMFSKEILIGVCPKCQLELRLPVKEKK